MLKTVVFHEYSQTGPTQWNYPEMASVETSTPEEMWESEGAFLEWLKDHLYAKLDTTCKLRFSHDDLKETYPTSQITNSDLYAKYTNSETLRIIQVPDELRLGVRGNLLLGHIGGRPNGSQEVVASQPEQVVSISPSTEPEAASKPAICAPVSPRQPQRQDTTSPPIRHPVVSVRDTAPAVPVSGFNAINTRATQVDNSRRVSSSFASIPSPTAPRVAPIAPAAPAPQPTSTPGVSATATFQQRVSVPQAASSQTINPQQLQRQPAPAAQAPQVPLYNLPQNMTHNGAGPSSFPFFTGPAPPPQQSAPQQQTQLSAPVMNAPQYAQQQQNAPQYAPQYGQQQQQQQQQQNAPQYAQQQQNAPQYAQQQQQNASQYSQQQQQQQQNAPQYAAPPQPQQLIQDSLNSYSNLVGSRLSLQSSSGAVIPLAANPKQIILCSRVMNNDGKMALTKVTEARLVVPQFESRQGFLAWVKDTFPGYFKGNANYGVVLKPSNGASNLDTAAFICPMVADYANATTWFIYDFQGVAAPPPTAREYMDGVSKRIDRLENTCRDIVATSSAAAQKLGSLEKLQKEGAQNANELHDNCKSLEARLQSIGVEFNRTINALGNEITRRLGALECDALASKRPNPFSEPQAVIPKKPKEDHATMIHFGCEDGLVDPTIANMLATLDHMPTVTSAGPDSNVTARFEMIGGRCVLLAGSKDKWVFGFEQADVRSSEPTEPTPCEPLVQLVSEVAEDTPDKSSTVGKPLAVPVHDDSLWPAESTNPSSQSQTPRAVVRGDSSGPGSMSLYQSFLQENDIVPDVEDLAAVSELPHETAAVGELSPAGRRSSIHLPVDTARVACESGARVASEGPADDSTCVVSSPVSPVSQVCDGAAIGKVASAAVSPVSSPCVPIAVSPVSCSHAPPTPPSPLSPALSVSKLGCYFTDDEEPVVSAPETAEIPDHENNEHSDGHRRRAAATKALDQTRAQLAAEDAARADARDVARREAKVAAERKQFDLARVESERESDAAKRKALLVSTKSVESHNHEESAVASATSENESSENGEQLSRAGPSHSSKERAIMMREMRDKQKRSSPVSTNSEVAKPPKKKKKRNSDVITKTVTKFGVIKSAVSSSASNRVFDTINKANKHSRG